MKTYVDYGSLGNGLLAITFACETMGVEIVCTPSEFAELRDKVEVAIRRGEKSCA